jgi:methoxymalonate biosynthesis protein
MTADLTQHRLAVIGAGVMGTNISALATGHGVDVVLVETDATALAAAKSIIKPKLRHAQFMGVLPADRPQGSLTVTASLADIADATTVVEAVTEVVEVKEQVLTAVSALVRPGTTLISNTSCISIDEMAAWVEHPEDLLGVHFMNPSYMIKMVEVIRGTRTGCSPRWAASPSSSTTPPAS